MTAHTSEYAQQRLDQIGALIADYVPTIKKQLECSERQNCGCTFCDFVDDLLRALRGEVTVTQIISLPEYEGLPCVVHNRPWLGMNADYPADGIETHLWACGCEVEI